MLKCWSSSKISNQLMWVSLLKIVDHCAIDICPGKGNSQRELKLPEDRGLVVYSVLNFLIFLLTFKYLCTILQNS